MNGRFVTMAGNPAVASYTKHKKHFTYLTLTPEQESALVAEAEKWAVKRVAVTKASHDEYGDHTDTETSLTRLTDFHGDIVVRNGKIHAAVNDHGIIRKDRAVVTKLERWESRSVEYITYTFTLVRVD